MPCDEHKAEHKECFIKNMRSVDRAMKFRKHRHHYNGARLAHSVLAEARMDQCSNTMLWCCAHTPVSEELARGRASLTTFIGF